MHRYFKRACFCLLTTAAVANSAAAQTVDDEIVVIGVTPGNGAGLPADKIPYNVRTATAEEIERSRSLDLSDFLNRNMGSVSLNDAQNNPLQPDIQYRGFTGSPLLGLAQGLAVYQNGVRINEPLGDTINWDLLPESAVQSIDLTSGSNPLFGLNTLGGALAVRMKNGFDNVGHNAEAWGGSFGRWVIGGESGANNGDLAYYANVQYFEENGWRDLSDSDNLNFYGSVGWRGAASTLNLNGQYGNSFLTGNGALPIELMELERDTVFTAPDITEHDMYMVSLDGTHDFSETVKFSGTAFYRRNKSDSFNGDASEFAICELGGEDRLLEGLEEDDLVELGLDDDDVCEDQYADADALEDDLNAIAAGLGLDEEFNLEDLTDDLSGTGVLSDEAINNQSTRVQKTRGFDGQFAFLQDLFGRGNQLVVGGTWFRGTSHFDAVLELAEMDPDTRSTEGLGTGIFVDDAATDIKTETETWSLYFTDTIDLTGQLTLTVSGRYNNTAVDLADQSGERPELNGEHDFDRFNPAVGLTFQATDQINLYGGYSESSRAPTPIELSCNDRIFEIARANAIAAGEDPDDIEFECRLPNAFLADPPLDQVVAKSWEAGLRGDLSETVRYHAGYFHTVNKDDILFQSTGRATGLFANVDETRRQGFEGELIGRTGKLDWFLAYSWIDATFQDDLEVLSPNHAFADEEEGTIEVSSGDRLPGIPEHQVKLGGDYYFTDDLSLGFDVVCNSDQVMRGDESNQLDTVDGYALVNLRGQWRISKHFQFFARISNLFDADYETFGLLGENPSEVEVPLFEDMSDPRFYGPGAPRAGFVGLKLSL
jgi:outer membrane receptor protein involved in Fe transport